MNFQLCFFVQYVAAFAVGVSAARQNWFEGLASSRVALRAGAAGLVFGPIALAAILKYFPPLSEPPALVGGWNWAALATAFWEQIAGVLIGVGVLGVFRRWVDKPSSLRRWLNENAFGVYLFHPPILVALTACFASWRASPGSKAVVLTVVGLACSFLFSAAARTMPWVRRYV